jgi:hypothetical protein
MLRRSVPFRMLAVALAGITLGACSGSTDDATAPSEPDAALTAVNPLNFYTSTTNLSFDVTGGTPASKTVEVGGLVVTTTPYVRVLSINYSPSNVKGWVRITQRPGLLEDGTLGVRLTFSIRIVPGLVPGATATVPITVPGARNGPQVITVSTGQVFGCTIRGNLGYPSLNPLVGDLQPGTTCQSEILGTGERVFDPWSVTVPAGATYTVMMRGQASDAGSLYDPYLFLVDPVLDQVVRQDDDCGDGFQSPYYDSRIVFTNPSASPKEYYLLASQFSLSQFGTYTIDIYDGVFVPGYTTDVCTGFDPNLSVQFMPGASVATDPAVAAVQKRAQAKHRQTLQ